jgi:hypothetical protein
MHASFRTRWRRRTTLVAIAAALVVVLGACETDPATNIGATSVTLNGKGHCYAGLAGEWQYQLRNVSANGGWFFTGKRNQFHCSANTASTPFNGEHIGGLPPSTTFQVRIWTHLSNGDVFTTDSNGTKHGTAYDSFTTLPASGSTGGVVGAAEGPPGANPAFNLDRLCEWSHWWDFHRSAWTNPPGKTSAGARSYCIAGSAYIYNTCHITIYAHATGWAAYTDKDQGRRGCFTEVTATCPDCWQARGSQAVYWFRLDNEGRRWTRGFRQGDDRIYCDMSWNHDFSPARHVMRCLTWSGNGPLSAKWSGDIAETPATRRAQRVCGDRPRGSACDSLAKEAIRSIPASAFKKHLDRLEKKGADGSR